jgi:hypothetical protein
MAAEHRLQLNLLVELLLCVTAGPERYGTRSFIKHRPAGQRPPALLFNSAEPTGVGSDAVHCGEINLLIHTFGNEPFNKGRE